MAHSQKSADHRTGKAMSKQDAVWLKTIWKDNLQVGFGLLMISQAHRRRGGSLHLGAVNILNFMEVVYLP